VTIWLNKHLDWAEHIRLTVNKLNSASYCIRVVGKYISENSLRVAYFANFESVLRYGIIMWGCSNRMQNVFVVQKRTIRLIKKMGYLQSCRTVFRSLRVLTVFGIYIYECIMFFFKNKTNLFQFPYNQDCRTRNLNANYPKHHLTLTEKCPYYRCVKLYNVLPERIKMITCDKVFKKAKNYLIELEPYNLRKYYQNL